MSNILIKKAGGALASVYRVRRYNGSSWDEVKTVYGKATGGALIEYHKTIVIDKTSSGSTLKLNMFTAAGSPADRVTCILDVGSNHTIYSDNVANPAVDTGTGWAAGSVLIIINRGEIYGMGGEGGVGGDADCASLPVDNGADGTAGGDAINLQHDLYLYNHGVIGGGGGGGGGGGAGFGNYSGSAYTYGGGGGGHPIRYTGGTNGAAGGSAACGGGTKADGQDAFLSGGQGNFGGNGGSGTNGGSGGTSASNDGVNGSTEVCGNWAHAGGGGGGGYWGGDGGSGGSGVACGSPTNSSTGTGGFGGSAGKAVEDNASTLTIKKTGTIYGATT